METAAARADVVVPAAFHERRRTIIALVSASVIRSSTSRRARRPPAARASGTRWSSACRPWRPYAVSDGVGSYLYGHVHLTFQQLVWVAAASTLAVLAFLPALPRALGGTCEGALPLGASS